MTAIQRYMWPASAKHIKCVCVCGSTFEHIVDRGWPQLFVFHVFVFDGVCIPFLILIFKVVLVYRFVACLRVFFDLIFLFL